MLKKSISIKCFEINKCGYYEYGNGNFVGCDTAETFNKLAVWLSTWSSIHQTATFQPREDTDEAKIYCYDFKKRRIQLASATPSKLNEKARWYSPLASPSNQRLRGVWAMHTLPGKNGTTSARQ